MFVSDKRYRARGYIPGFTILLAALLLLFQLP